jgi:hypothetical protein
MLWEKDGDIYFSVVADPAGTAVFHLIVEALPDGTWTWTVWRPGDPPRLARYGTSDTVQGAMQRAEQATE